MSVKVTARVWEHADQTGGALLVLLALADFADDRGVCWPNQSKVAQYARLTERQCRRVLHQLARDGEILMQSGLGRGHTTVYMVLAGLSDEERDEKRNVFPEIMSAFQDKSGHLRQEKRTFATGKSGHLRQEKRTFDASENGGLNDDDAPNPDPIRHDPSEEIRHGSGGGGGSTSDHHAPPPLPLAPALAQLATDVLRPGGKLTDTERQKLLAMQAAYSANWLELALHEALNANVSKLGYVESILKRAAADGRPPGSPKPNRGTNGTHHNGRYAEPASISNGRLKPDQVAQLAATFREVGDDAGLRQLQERYGPV